MIMPVKSLTTLAEHGPHGQRVRVIVERGLVRVKYSENGARRFRSWTDSPSNRKTAKAWARAFSETRDTRSFAVPALAASLTTSGLWDAFTLAEFPHLREKTAKNYSLYWRKWQAFVGEATPIDTVTREAVDRYAAELLKVHVASEVRRHIKLVTHVYSWAVERDLSMAVKVASYRVKLSRDAAKSEPTTEFRSADSEKLLAYFDPAIQPANASRKWRVYVIQMILSLLGARINAVLHLRRDDINLSGRDGVSMPTITWRAEWDKVG